MPKKNILVVDDDPAICRLLSSNLGPRGYDVSIAVNGEQALGAAESQALNLIILDLMMPGMDGVEVCRRIREWSKVPVIVLSARGNENDKIRCLELGADDYLTKPFGMGELLARIKTALRHAEVAGEAAGPASFICGEMEINFARRRVTLGASEVKLTPTEYGLLQQLVTNANKVLTHRMLLQRVWGEEYQSESQYLRVFIGRLRRKLEADPDNPKYIMTTPGVGYYFATG